MTFIKCVLFLKLKSVEMLSSLDEFFNIAANFSLISCSKAAFLVSMHMSVIEIEGFTYSDKVVFR